MDVDAPATSDARHVVLRELLCAEADEEAAASPSTGWLARLGVDGDADDPDDDNSDGGISSAGSAAASDMDASDLVGEQLELVRHLIELDDPGRSALANAFDPVGDAPQQARARGDVTEAVVMKCATRGVGVRFAGYEPFSIGSVYAPRFLDGNKIVRASDAERSAARDRFITFAHDRPAGSETGPNRATIIARGLTYLIGRWPTYEELELILAVIWGLFEKQDEDAPALFGPVRRELVSPADVQDVYRRHR